MVGRILVIGFLLTFASCSNFVSKHIDREPSSDLMILHTPKQLGYITIGRTKFFKATMSSPTYVLKEDLERDEIYNDEKSPIGDFVLKPGTVIKLSQETRLYLKPSMFIGSKNIDDSIFLKQGTKVRILSYESQPLSTETIAIIEVIE